MKDDKDDLVADSHSIVARWRNYFSQTLKVHGVNDVRQTEIHTAEPIVPEPSAAEVELAIKKLKSNKSPGIDQIPAELIRPRGKTVRFMNLLFPFGMRKNCRRTEEWKESIIVPVYKKN